MNSKFISIYTTFIIIFLFSNCLYASNSINNGLSLYWNGSLDWSSNNNNPVKRGIQNVDNRFGQLGAYGFGELSSDKVIFAYNNIPLTNDYTLFLWAKLLPSNSNESLIGNIIYKGSDNLLYFDSGRIISSNYTDQLWHNIVLMRSGTELSAYVDNILVGTTTVTSEAVFGSGIEVGNIEMTCSLRNTDREASCGGSFGGYGGMLIPPSGVYANINMLTLQSIFPSCAKIESVKGLKAFKGVLDDIRIYNRAITIAEIETLTSDSFKNITATVFGNGSINPSGRVAESLGSNETFTVTPDQGYAISDVMVDGTSVGPVTSHTFNSIELNHSIHAEFIKLFDVTTTVTEGSGSITPSLTLTSGTNKTIVITPAVGNHLVSVKDNDQYVFTKTGIIPGTYEYVLSSISNHHNIQVAFAVDTFTLSSTSGAGGTITPFATSTVNYGDNLIYTILPASGFKLATFTDNAIDKLLFVTANSYTITNITANHTIIAGFTESQKPVVTAFTTPAIGTTSAIAVSSFTATDNVAVTGYLLTESATVPLVTATGWSATKPTSYTFAGIPDGIATDRTLFAWAKDAAGNISNNYAATTTITLPDITKSVITDFTVPSTATTLTVFVLSFTATDNVAVTGYLLTESATVPLVTATGWSVTKPTSYTFSGIPEGIATARTLYAWVKDTRGNISNSATATTTINLPDVTPPVVTVFTIVDAGTNTSVPVKTLTATDNVAVTEYLLTETNTTPAITATGWSATKPTSYTFSGIPDGIATTKILYAWVKDVAGNVSTGYLATVLVDTTAPQLIISTLADNARTNNATLNISGIATDNTSLASLLINSEPVTMQPDGSFSTALGLLIGNNSITVTAIDIAGNRTVQTRTIILDQDAPQITVTTPADNSIISQSSSFVSGSVDENADLQIIDEPGAIHLPNRNGNAFSAYILLTTGLNTLTVNALDLAGNPGSAKRTVTYDPLAPSLSITTPAEDTIDRDGLVTISGLVTDTISAVTLSLTADDKSYTPIIDNTGHFSQNLTLPEEGTYPVQVTAIDDAGNSTGVTRNILYTHGLISINQGAEVTSTTSVKLALDYYPTAAKMRFCSNNSSWTAWAIFAPTKTVLVSAGDGVKTVYVQFLGADGVESLIYFDSIRLDTLPPKGSLSINNGAAYTNSLNVALTLVLAESANGVQMQFSTNQTTWSAWESFSPNKNWSFTGAEGAKTLFVRFKDSAGKISAIASDAISYKVSSPTAGSSGAIVINNAASATKTLAVSLTINKPDVTYTQMQFSSNGLTWTAWESFKTPRAFTLPVGDGIKTIYVRFKSPTSTSGLYSDSILLDTKLPVGTISLNNGAAVTSSPILNLTLNASDLNGVTEMQFSENGTLWSNLEPYQASRSYTLPQSTLDGSKKLYVRFKDSVGNFSVAVSDTIKLDRVAPLGSVLINANSATITSLTVPLTLKAPGAITMQLSLDGGSTWGSWEPYVTTKSATLPDGDGTKTVQARFRDLAGNISLTVSDSTSITTAPMPATLTVPASDLDGKYPITWGRVVTTGVTYTLEEATNADFTAGKRVAYAGTATTVNIPLRTIGKSYFYRVRTNKSGWAASSWVTGSNGCKVGP